MTDDRKARFVSIVQEMADDKIHGYSQKPPSGRWGPDFDCSSFIYEAADRAGYDVGRGKDKVRFTGTLAEDFKKAGFQILPFANVGLGELEVGDILLNLALHAEVYVGEGQSVGAMSSETGGYVGEAGDQTGKEIEKHPVYELDKGWDYVVRPPQDEGEEEDSSEEDGEGDAEMPSYPNMGGQMNYGGWQGRGNWLPNANGYQPMSGYPQGYNPAAQQGYGAYQGYQNQGYQNQPYQNQGYPQGNLGQMNGYSQANQGYGAHQPGGVPMGQQGGRQQPQQVRSIEEMNNLYVAPGDCVTAFNWNESLMYMKSADQDGVPSIRVFKFEECSEEMPQHGGMFGGGQMPMGQSGGNMVTRQEFEQLKEMIGNVQSAVMGSAPGQSDGYRQGNEPDGAQSGSNDKQQNGRSNRNA